VRIASYGLAARGKAVGGFAVRRATLFQLLLLAALAGCAARPQIVLGPAPEERLDLDSLLAQNSVAPGEPLRAVPLKRTESSSLVLVQIRTREEPHIHATHDLTVSVLRGKGKILLISTGSGIDATRYTGALRSLRAGDAVSIPHGTIHWFINDGRKPAVALASFSPPFDGKDNVPAGAGAPVDFGLLLKQCPAKCESMDFSCDVSPSSTQFVSWTMTCNGRIF
jgi:quercetin dioxygenase-like cupin family protein